MSRLREAGRYDDFVFIDKTSALQPLDQGFLVDRIPETWPQGM